MLEKVNVVAYKVSSMDITNLPLLKYIASTGKPMIMSTGMATIAEIVEAVDKVKEEGNNQIVLLHCISKYPVDAAEANLRNIPYFKETFDLPVGYSDHGVDSITSYVAVSLGACLIEKHFTIDKTMPGPDHKLSVNPLEMTQLVQGIRTIEQNIGKLFNTIERPDRKEATMFRRSIYSKVDIKKGSIINPEMIKCVRPGNGLPPKYLNIVLDRTANVDIPKDTPITFDVI
jgi:sialic acid synthase SpsE